MFVVDEHCHCAWLKHLIGFIEPKPAAKEIGSRVNGNKISINFIASLRTAVWFIIYVVVVEGRLFLCPNKSILIH